MGLADVVTEGQDMYVTEIPQSFIFVPKEVLQNGFKGGYLWLKILRRVF